MPIIDIGAPKPGMSGQGWVDPMAELKDIEAQERDDNLFGAAIKVIGAAWSGKRQFEDREKASQAKSAQVGLNESLGRVRAGGDPNSEILYIERGSWASEELKNKYPGEYERLKDSALGALSPAESSYSA